MKVTDHLEICGHYFRWLDEQEQIAHGRVTMSFHSLSAWLVETEDGRAYLKKLMEEAE
jgi:hypothetical protein